MTSEIGAEVKIITIKQFDKLWQELKEQLIEKRFFLDKKSSIFKEYISYLNKPKYLNSDKICYRSRVNDTGKPFENICNNLNAPPKNKCDVGRLNAKGIRYLYLSGDIKTSVSEVRPWIDSIVEVAKFKVKNDNSPLIIKDLLPDNAIIDSIKKENMPKDKKESEIKEAKVKNKLKEAISQKFSQPISGNRSELKYLITQCITEYIRDYDMTSDNKKYDGIRYASSVCENGYNILIFDPDKMELIDDELAARVKISKHDIDYTDL